MADLFSGFKANHGGLGPFQAFERAGVGLLQHLNGVAQQRTLTDQMIQQVQQDSSMEGLQPLIAAGSAPMTVKEHQAYRAQVMNEQSAQQTLNKVTALDTKRLDELQAMTKDPDRLDKIANMRNQLETSHDLLTSLDPRTQALGAAGYGSFHTAIDAYSSAVETEDIAARNKYGDDTWTHYQGLQADANTQDSVFISQQGAMNRIQQLTLLPNTSESQKALLINALQVIRPGVVVRGDGSDLDNLEGVPDIYKTFYRKLILNDQILPPDEMTQLLDTTGAAYMAGRNDQADRNARRKGAATALGLPDDLITPLMQPLGNAPPIVGLGSKDKPTKDHSAAALALTALTAGAGVLKVAGTPLAAAAGAAGPAAATAVAKGAAAYFTPLAAMLGMGYIMAQPPKQMPNESDAQFKVRQDYGMDEASRGLTNE